MKGHEVGITLEFLPCSTIYKRVQPPLLFILNICLKIFICGDVLVIQELSYFLNLVKSPQDVFLRQISVKLS